MSLTFEEKEAVAGYTSSLYSVINGALRYHEDVDDSVQVAIERLDSAIDKSSITEAITVYRGVGEDYAAELQRRAIEIGDILSDAGFLSTSKREKVARRFLGIMGGGLLFKIRIPKGRKGLSAGPYSKYSDEEEILLPRDAELRVIGYDAENDALELEVM